MKKTIRLGSFLLAFLLLVCTLPVTACAASTVNLNQNYLFRPRDNAFSIGAGETATLTFTPPVHCGLYLAAEWAYEESLCETEKTGRYKAGV